MSPSADKTRAPSLNSLFKIGFSLSPIDDSYEAGTRLF
jgi:hypothetical protein